MAVYEALTEEEKYLFAVLQDPSGLDQAEFLWSDYDQPDNCWRAWAFQWPWWRDMSKQQIEQAGRSLGKSLSIRARAFAFPFVHPGQEMVITAPEGNHLDQITDVIETGFEHTRLMREMIAKGRRGITHRPFHVIFANGARIVGRIPQKDGKGLKGTHPIWLEMDEAQDFPEPAWMEIVSTLKSSFVGAVWRAHGVTKGPGDHFWKYTQPGSGWKVHRVTAMHRPPPHWSADERQRQVELFGSYDSPDYRRNVMGMHGDASNPLFVTARLLACVDHDKLSEYNSYDYSVTKINNEMVMDVNEDIMSLLRFPEHHKDYDRIWIGMDVGYTNDPSVVLVFAEDTPTKKGPGRLKLLTKVIMERISAPHQAEAILHFITFYQPQAFSMDKTGNGLPLFQLIQSMVEKNPSLSRLLGIIKGYNFSEKILVDFDPTVEFDPDVDDQVKEAGVFRNVLEYSSDKLRQMVDQKRLHLPWDEALLKEFRNESFTYDKSRMDQYGRRKSFNSQSSHTLDAARMAVLGFTQDAIEKMTKDIEKYEPVTPVFLY